jgi:hypothetical protein
MVNINETVTVLVDQDGVPTFFIWKKRNYKVYSRPSRWFAKAEWWTGESARIGIGPDVVEIEFWRLRVADFGFVELSHHSRNDSWFLTNWWGS